VPRVHVIEGAAGCRFSVERGCVAVVVDALRASSTAAMLLHHGCRGVLAVTEVDEAFAAKRDLWPDALLYGERGGLPPEGFDHGNSPAEAAHAAGHRIIFTTTTGAGRLVACWGAPAVYMGAALNATAVAQAAAGHGRDVVVIPAGLATDPDFDAQEDRAAAALIARRTGLPLGEGAQAAAGWLARIDAEGIPALFEGAPHAGKLRAVGLGDDVARCAAVDATRAVPAGVERLGPGVRLAAHPG
jgi:2-phosphosulfolactate phosphatase